MIPDIISINKRDKKMIGNFYLTKLNLIIIIISCHKDFATCFPFLTWLFPPFYYNNTYLPFPLLFSSAISLIAYNIKNSLVKRNLVISVILKVQILNINFKIKNRQ